MAAQARVRVDVTAVLVAGASPTRTRAVRAALEASTARPGSLVEGDLASAADRSPTRWLWLLHDDVVPDPTALEALLACADARPDAGLVGPAVVDAGDPRRLLELGVTVDGTGRRRTGVEPGELDQGQHDRVRDVLAVSTAGALVRRDDWVALGGLDPALPPGADDVDLGWRLRAAGRAVLVVPRARVRRQVGPAGHDRTALVVPLLHAGRVRLPLVLLRCVLGVVLRALALLLTRRPAAAAAELRALRPLARPRVLLEGRRRRRASRTAPPSQVRALLARRRTSLRGVLLDTAERVAGAGRSSPRRRPGPGLLLVVGLAVLATAAQRSLLGAGRLAGGALVPGQAAVAQELLLLATVPLAGAAAWAAAGRVATAPVLRAWCALTWALLPVVTGTVAAGRLDLAVLAAALPLLLAGGWSVLADDPRRDAWRRVWALALGLLVVGAVAPQVLRAAAVLLLVPAALVAVLAAPAARRAARRRLAACATALAVPVLVLLPGLAEAPATDGAPSAVQLLLAHDTAGPPPAALTAGLLLAGAVALLRTARPRLALGGWGLALAGLVPALLDPATGVLLVHAGVLLAVVAGADGLPQWLGSASFGRRQVGALVVGATAALVPVLCAAVWLVAGGDGPLARRSPVVLPAFVLADTQASGTSSLLLRPRPDGAVGWALTEQQAGPQAEPALGRAVTDLLSDGESRAADALGRRGVAWVALADPRAELVAALDTEPGLSREGGGAPLLWRVTAPVTPTADAPAAPARTAAQALALAVLVVLAAAPVRPAGRRSAA